MRTEDALYKAVTGGRSRVSEGTIAGAIRDVERAAGGVHARAAQRAGIGVSTWRHLRAGRKPSKATTEKLLAAQRRARLSSTRERKLRGRPVIGVWAETRISNDERPRRMLVSDWVDKRKPGSPDVHDVMPEVTELFLQGRDREAADLFTTAVDGGVAGDLHLLDVKEIRVFDHHPEGVAWQRLPV